jgi:hypothetical protein
MELEGKTADHRQNDNALESFIDTKITGTSTALVKIL